MRALTKSVRGHFLVRPPLGDELGDPTLGRRQLAVGCGSAADPAELGSGFLRPERRAELLEDLHRLVQGRPRVPLALGTPLRPTEGQERAGAVERHRHARVLCQSLLERPECAFAVACCCREQPATAQPGGERRSAIERAASLLEPPETLLGLVQPSERDERLDLVGDEADRPRLADSGREQPLSLRSEHAGGLLRPIEGELEQAERPDGVDLAHRPSRAPRPA